MPADKSGGLNSIPRTHRAEGETEFPQVPTRTAPTGSLIFKHILWHEHTHTYTHIKNLKRDHLYYPEEAEGNRREGEAGSGRESRVVSVKLPKSQDSQACILNSKTTLSCDDLIAHSASNPGRLKLTLTSGSQWLRPTQDMGLGSRPDYNSLPRDSNCSGSHRFVCFRSSLSPASFSELLSLNTADCAGRPPFSHHWRSSPGCLPSLQKYVTGAMKCVLRL